MARQMIVVFVVLLLSAAPLTASAQFTPGAIQAGVKAVPTQTNIVEPPRQTQSIPYYVDPSRFYYNRPTPGVPNAGRYSSPTYYNYNLRPNCYYGYGYYGPINGWSYVRRGPVYYNPYIRGVTEHVGPFIPY